MPTNALRNRGLAGLSLLIAWATATGIAAHEVRPAIADVEIRQDVVEIEIRLALEVVVAGVDLTEFHDTSASPQAAEYDRLRKLEPDALDAALRASWTQIREGFHLHAGQSRLVPELVGTEIPEMGDIDLPRDSILTLAARLPGGDEPVSIGWTASYGALIVRQMGAGEDAYTGYLTGGEATPPLPRVGAAD